MEELTARAKAMELEAKTCDEEPRQFENELQAHINLIIASIQELSELVHYCIAHSAAHGLSEDPQATELLTSLRTLLRENGVSEVQSEDEHLKCTSSLEAIESRLTRSNSSITRTREDWE
jgi:hypothetical protein